MFLSHGERTGKSRGSLDVPRSVSRVELLTDLIERSLTHSIRSLSGKLGVVEEGALADLLLVDGDPLSDIKLVANANQNLS
jgi:hypothetical protein